MMGLAFFLCHVMLRRLVANTDAKLSEFCSNLYRVQGKYHPDGICGEITDR